jgi:hypothetical protein
LGAGPDANRGTLVVAGGAVEVLPASGVFPEAARRAAAAGHIRVALGVDAGIAAGQESERTFWRHRDFVRARVGTRYEPGEARQVVETAIRVEAKDDPADLINVALDEVVRAWQQHRQRMRRRVTNGKDSRKIPQQVV